MREGSPSPRKFLSSGSILVALLLVLFLGQTAVAGSEFSYLKPVTVTRGTGGPTETQITFQVINPSAAGPFTLVVENGAGGGGRVDAARITLNGTVVVRPKAFNERVASVTRDVTPYIWAGHTNNNSLVVEVRGAPGDSLSVQVVGPPARVTLLYTSEHHGNVEPVFVFPIGNFGGMAARATLVDQIRAEEGGAQNVMLLDSGDLLIGTTLSTLFRGAPDILLMNLIGYDAQAIGNHEHDFGLAHLAGMINGDNLNDVFGDPIFPIGLAGDPAFDFSQGAKFPLLSANTIDTNTGTTPAEFDNPILIRQVGDVSVGVFGITTPQTPAISSPPANFAFEDPATTAAGIVAEIGGLTDVIVALTHMDNVEDVTLLNSVAGVDVVLGGHVEGFAGIFTRQDELVDGVPPDDLPSVLNNPDGIFARPGRLGAELGRLDLLVADEGIVHAEQQNIVVEADSIAPDPDVLAVLAPFQAKRDVLFNIVIGSTSVRLDGDRSQIRTRETNLGNFINDALRAASGADIAVHNGGGIRDSIEIGDITLGDIIGRVLPFPNTLATIDIDGATVLEILESSVGRISVGGVSNGLSSGGFLQVSGISFAWDGTQPPGSRVIPGSVMVDGVMLDPAQIFKVASSNFTINGGDTFPEFLANGQNLFDTQILVADVVKEVIENAPGPIAPGVEGRIVRVDPP